MGIHFTYHRLELAVKDTFETDSAFQDVDEILLEMYLLTRYSGKVKRLIKLIAMQLNVIFVTVVKFSGTTFENQNYRAIKAFIISYIAIAALMENYL